MRVYVAAPFGRVAEALEAHALLVSAGLTPSARWVEAASKLTGKESLSWGYEGSGRAIAENDADLATSAAVIAMAWPGEGGEMFAEVRFFTDLGRPLYWVGERKILSAYRPGVVHVGSLDEAVAKCVMQRDRKWPVLSEGQHGQT